MAPAERNPKVLSTLAFVFLAGAVVGALTMRLGLHEKLHRTVSAASLPAPLSAPLTPGSPATPASTDKAAAPKASAAPSGNAAILQRFKSELDLTPAQTVKIAAVLDDYQQYYQSLQDQLDDLRGLGRSRIVQILEPAQREKFEKIMSQMQPQLEGK